MSSPVRIGILGAARIAAAFVAGARLSSQAEVVAVASREAAKAEGFARTHGIARALSYEQLLAARDIDAVYIPLPNSLHAHWSIAAARAVLIETRCLKRFTQRHHEQSRRDEQRTAAQQQDQPGDARDGLAGPPSPAVDAPFS